MNLNEFADKIEKAALTVSRIPPAAAEQMRIRGSV
jgi:hypothetical protein